MPFCFENVGVESKQCGPHHPVLRYRYNSRRVAEQYRRWRAGASTSRSFDLLPPLSILGAMGKEVNHQVKGRTSMTYARGHGCSAAQRCVLPMLMLKWWFAKFPGLEKGNQDLEGGSRRGVRILRMSSGMCSVSRHKKGWTKQGQRKTMEDTLSETFYPC